MTVDLGAVLVGVAAIITALGGIAAVALRRHKRAMDKVEAVLTIVRGNGEGTVDEMQEATLSLVRSAVDQLDRLERQVQNTDDRVQGIDRRVDGISKHQRQDREALAQIQTAVTSMKDAAAATVDQVQTLEGEVATIKKRQELEITGRSFAEIAQVLPIRESTDREPS